MHAPLDRIGQPNPQGASSKFLATRKRMSEGARSCLLRASLLFVVLVPHTYTTQLYYRESRKQQQPATMADKEENAAALEKKE